MAKRRLTPRPAGPALVRGAVAAIGLSLAGCPARRPPPPMPPPPMPPPNERSQDAPIPPMPPTPDPAG